MREVVVGADGRRSTVARVVGAADEERHAPARAMYYRYARGWPGLDPVGPEFLLQGHRFSYVFPSDAAVACLAVSVTSEEHLRTHGDSAGLLEDAFRSNPQTAARMDEIEWVSATYTGLPADSVWRAGCGPGWALVGDAGTMQDPWAGLGMDTAARQAEAFADAFQGDAWTSAYPALRRDRTYEAYSETTRLAPDLRQLVA